MPRSAVAPTQRSTSSIAAKCAAVDGELYAASAQTGATMSDRTQQAADARTEGRLVCHLVSRTCRPQLAVRHRRHGRRAALALNAVSGGDARALLTWQMWIVPAASSWQISMADGCTTAAPAGRATAAFAASTDGFVHRFADCPLLLTSFWARASARVRQPEMTVLSPPWHAGHSLCDHMVHDARHLATPNREMSLCYNEDTTVKSARPASRASTLRASLATIGPRRS